MRLREELRLGRLFFIIDATVHSSLSASKIVHSNALCKATAALLIVYIDELFAAVSGPGYRALWNSNSFSLEQIQTFYKFLMHGNAP